MKKKILCLMMAAVLAVGAPLTAFARDYQGADGWQATFDGSKLTATHPAEGEYTISMPTNWFSSADDVGVILNGVGSVEGSSKSWGKPTLLTRATNSIKIGMSDNESANNAAFDFMIFNKNDWATI